MYKCEELNVQNLSRHTRRTVYFIHKHHTRLTVSLADTQMEKLDLSFISKPVPTPIHAYRVFKQLESNKAIRPVGN